VKKSNCVAIISSWNRLQKFPCRRD